MFHWNIQKYIEEKQLFTLHDKVLVALSGGADSVALLRVLLVLGYHCEAAHCNFHLRGEESDRDERFVNELCKGLGVTLHVTHFDTVTYASRHHVSVEMAAREMRYDWFEQLRKERGMAVIAVAHHRDDSVETFLLNLIRGVALGLIAFMFGTAAGVLFGKLMCVFSGGKINPLIGSAGVSAVPMAARVSQKVGAESDPTNFLLMHAMGPNVAGVIGTAVAAGTFMAIFGVF